MGLGHVQRSLPLMRALLSRGAALTVVSHGRALQALKIELQGEAACTFYDVPDYPPLQRGRGLAHYVLYLKDLLEIRARAVREAQVLKDLHAKTPFDLVVADGRFGWVTPGVPCFLVIHQVKVLLPWGFRPFQWISDVVQRQLLSRYTHLIVLDLPDPTHSLAGRLAHTRILRGLSQTWIGPTSTLDRAPDEGSPRPETDLLFVMGGFIEAERRAFVQWLYSAVAEHPGLRVGLLLGGGTWAPDALPPGAQVWPLALGAERARLMAGARLIVGRTGHTTLMDLRAMGAGGGRGLLFPTPMMTEHIELARIVRGFGHQIQDPLARSLAASLEALAHPTLPPHLRPVRFDAIELPEPLQRWTTAQSVRRFLGVVNEHLTP